MKIHNTGGFHDVKRIRVYLAHSQSLPLAVRLRPVMAITGGQQRNREDTLSSAAQASVVSESEPQPCCRDGRVMVDCS
jgi:hypothetical protein